MNSGKFNFFIKFAASRDSKAHLFLFFLFLSFVGESFIENAFKFVAYELTHSQSIVSLIGSISAVAFITLGLVSGMVVDAVSRRFFAVVHLIVFSVVYQSGLASIGLLFVFILLHEISSAFHKAANNTIFFDLCGTSNLSRWISRRSIAITAASMASALLLTIIVGSGALFFVIYSVILASAYLVFKTLKYTDQNTPQRFTTSTDYAHFFMKRFSEFIAICIERKALLLLFIFSFLKTFFIFWPMASGALFKFGIEDDETRRLYLIAIIIMDVVSMASLFVIGRKHTFSNRTFMLGALVSGVGILLFARAETTSMLIATLAIMYVGLAISQVSSSFILRMELPESHRTQGLSFAVVPYYLADIFSGLCFALLLTITDVDTLLFGAGLGLIVLCVLAFPFAHQLAATARRNVNAQTS